MNARNYTWKRERNGNYNQATKDPGMLLESRFNCLLWERTVAISRLAKQMAGTIVIASTVAKGFERCKCS